MSDSYFDIKNTVTKSNHLILSNYKLTIQQQKIVCAVASKIRMSDTEFTEYVFHMKKLAQLLELNQRGYYSEVRKVIRSLQTQVFTINKIVDGEVKSIDLTWFYRAEYNETKQTVSLKFAEDLKPFLIQLKDNFTSYKLMNIVKLDSSYSLRLYEILSSKAFSKQFEINLEELYTMILNQYKKYNDFKRNVLEKCQKELGEKTDIAFTFEEIKTGRKVTSIKFTIKKSKNANNEISATKEEPKQDINMQNGRRVKNIIENISDIDAIKIFNIAGGDIEKIKEKYSIISKFRNVHNLTGAMIQAIREEWTTNSINNSTFHNFEGRTYDYDELEKKLLGWE
jgi:plasmid replication initiation protein